MINKRTRLEVLREVKNDFLTERKSHLLPYICVYVGRSLRVNHMDSFIEIEEIFNFDTAKRICQRLHLKMPKKNVYRGWWADDDYKTRLAVINALIKEAEEL